MHLGSVVLSHLNETLSDGSVCMAGAPQSLFNISERGHYEHLTQSTSGDIITEWDANTDSYTCTHLGKSMYVCAHTHTHTQASSADAQYGYTQTSP